MIDLFREFTDQYNMVKLGVRCEAENKEFVQVLLDTIHSGAEVASQLYEGYDDRLKLAVRTENFPQQIRYGERTYIKNIHYA